MKWSSSVVFLLLGVLYSSTTVSGYFYEQRISLKLLTIDQFETRTWENKYYLDDSNYTPGGPMFVATGAYEMFPTDFWLNYTHFYDMGREMNALLVYTEHRFFGESRPTP